MPFHLVPWTLILWPLFFTVNPKLRIQNSKLYLYPCYIDIGFPWHFTTFCWICKSLNKKTKALRKKSPLRWQPESGLDTKRLWRWQIITTTPYLSNRGGVFVYLKALPYDDREQINDHRHYILHKRTGLCTHRSVQENIKARSILWCAGRVFSHKRVLSVVRILRDY